MLRMFAVMSLKTPEVQQKQKNLLRKDFKKRRKVYSMDQASRINGKLEFLKS